MRRAAIAIVLAAASCGGKRAPTTGPDNHAPVATGEPWAARAGALCAELGGNANNEPTGLPLPGVTYADTAEGWGDSAGMGGSKWTVVAPPTITRVGVLAKGGRTIEAWIHATVPAAEICAALGLKVEGGGCERTEQGRELSVGIAEDADGPVLACRVPREH